MLLGFFNSRNQAKMSISRLKGFHRNLLNFTSSNQQKQTNLKLIKQHLPHLDPGA